MTGLVPAIHVLKNIHVVYLRKTDVDAWHKAGHDEDKVSDVVLLVVVRCIAVDLARYLDHHPPTGDVDGRHNGVGERQQ